MKAVSIKVSIKKFLSKDVGENFWTRFLALNVMDNRESSSLSDTLY
jgi:hypothetical protein